MTSRPLIAAIAVLAIGARAAAAQEEEDDDGDGDGGRAAAAVTGRVLVGPDARWDSRAAVVPALTAQLGPSLLSALDQARGGPAAPSVFGAAPGDLPPPTPLPSAATAGRCNCA